MAIAVDGIVSGLDTTAIIDSLVAVYSIPKESLEQKVEDYEETQEAISGVISRMEDIQAALEAIDTSSEFRAYSASSSDENAVLAEVDGDAIAGAYEVETTQLATSEMEVSEAFASMSDADTIAYGTYSITYGGTATEITLDSSETSLQDLADAINDTTDGVEGVTAYIINNGDAATPYQLVLVGEDTGADNTIEFAAVSTAGAGVEPTFTETQAALDAEVTVNGLSIASDSNTLDDVIPGMTLTLTEVTSGAVTVTVAQDTETMEANLQAFVDAYNELASYIDTNSVYNYDEGIRGPLVGETSVTLLMSSLQSALTAQYESGSEYDALSKIGLELDSSGTLSLDSEALDDAMAANFDEVEALFTADNGFTAAMLTGYENGLGEEIGAVFDLYLDEDTGSLETRYDSLESRIEDVEDQIADYEERIERYEERLRAQYENMEVTLGLLEATTSYLEAILSTDDDD